MLDELQRVGFNRNQANVYYTLLQLGRCTVQQLANATGLNRVTTHGIVEHLEKLELCYSVRNGKARHIVPLDPIALQFLLKSQSAQVLDREQAYGKLAPLLRKLYDNPHRRPEVVTLVGESTYQYLIEDVITTGLETSELLNIDLTSPEDLKLLEQQYVVRKCAKQIPTRLIVPDTPAGHRHVEELYLRPPGASPVVARYLPTGDFCSTNLIIYGERLAFMSSTERLAILVNEADGCWFLQQCFLYNWERAGQEVTNR